MTVRLNTEDLRRLRILAEREHRMVSSLVDQAVKEFLEQYRDKPLPPMTPTKVLMDMKKEERLAALEQMAKAMLVEIQLLREDP